MVCASASFWAMPPEPMVSALALLLPNVNAPAVLVNVSERMLRLESRLGVRRTIPPKVTGAVPSLSGSPLGLQFCVEDQLLLVAPPSQRLPATDALGSAPTAARPLMAAARKVLRRLRRLS